MSLAAIDFRHLRYLVAVVEQRSFGRAALRLQVSQQPQTCWVRQLEEALGVPLRLGKSRGVEPVDPERAPSTRQANPDAESTLRGVDSAPSAEAKPRGKRGSNVR